MPERYNIYIYVGNVFGGYSHTGLFDSYEDAMIAAANTAEDMYNKYRGTKNIPCKMAVKVNTFIKYHSLFFLEDVETETKERLIDYSVILTDEDTLAEDDLIQFGPPV